MRAELKLARQRGYCFIQVREVRSRNVHLEISFTVFFFSVSILFKGGLVFFFLNQHTSEWNEWKREREREREREVSVMWWKRCIVLVGKGSYNVWIERYGIKVKRSLSWEKIDSCFPILAIPNHDGLLSSYHVFTRVNQRNSAANYKIIGPRNAKAADMQATTINLLRSRPSWNSKWTVKRD